MFIQHNAAAFNAYRNWTSHNDKFSKALLRLSTGKRINSAADDPAGLGISERMKSQLTALKVDQDTVAAHMSMISAADGSMGEMSSMLDRMQELAARAATETLSANERKNLDAEYQQLLSEINRLGIGSSFQSRTIFQGAGGIGASQVEALNPETVIRGTNLDAYLDSIDQLMADINTAAKAGDDEKLLSLGIDRSNGKSDSENLRNAILKFTEENASQLLNQPSDSNSGLVSEIILGSGGSITVNMPKIDKESLGLKDTSLLTPEDAKKAMEAVSHAIDSISSYRGNLGATYNRLEHTASILSNTEINLTDFLSRITDADMAREMMTYVREQLLSQAAMFAMIQSSHQPSDILTLLKSL